MKDFRIPMSRKKEKMLGNDVFFKIETEMSGEHFFLKPPQLQLSERSKILKRSSERNHLSERSKTR